MPSESEILDSIESSFQLLKNEKSNPSREKKILRLIRKLKNPSSDKLRLAAAQWVVIYNMMEFSKSENEKQIEAILKDVTNDMRKALKLIDKDFVDKGHRTTATLIAADIAQKISDFGRLEKSYKEIIKMAPNNPQLNYLALSIAPSMADWRRFYHICKAMESSYNEYNKREGADTDKQPRITEALHQMAQPGTPDLGVIYDIVSEYGVQNLKTPDSKELFEQTAAVSKVDLTIEKIVAESEDRMNEIREQFDKEKVNDFVLENLTINVNGGLVMVPGLSKDVQLMLVGPYFDENRIIVEGYIDLQLQDTDENGEPKGEMDQAALNAKLMESMSPEIAEAINSGQITPEMVMDAMTTINSPVAAESNNPLLAPGSDGKPLLADSLKKMAAEFEKIGPEMMQKCGISLVRQQERMELHRCNDGYEGTYFVRNYNPMNKSDETSLMLNIRMHSESLRKPAVSQQDKERAVEAGIDDLSLE